MVIVLVCLVASLAILKEAPLPWALAGLVYAAGAGLLCWRAASGSRARVLWFHAAAAILGVALAELWLAGAQVRRASTPTPTPRGKGTW